MPYVWYILITVIQVVASQDWPEVTKYAGLVCAQPHREELIQDLFRCWKDPQRGVMYGGMIRYLTSISSKLVLCEICLLFSLKFYTLFQIHTGTPFVLTWFFFKSLTNVLDWYCSNFQTSKAHSLYRFRLKLYTWVKNVFELLTTMEIIMAFLAFIIWCYQRLHSY